MCLLLTTEQEPTISKNDRLVYKLGTMRGGEFCPWIKTYFRYTLNVPTPFVELEKLQNLIRDNLRKYPSIVNEGYHSYINRPSNELPMLREVMKLRGERAVIGKFIIPKGVPHYINFEYNEIVSSQLIFKGL